MEHCNCKTTVRSADEKKALLNRLSRLEGQIRGIKSMVENDAYCVDILTQSAAAKQAFNAFSRELLNKHMRSCVIRDIRDGKDESVDELMDILSKMMR